MIDSLKLRILADQLTFLSHHPTLYHHSHPIINKYIISNSYFREIFF